MKRSPKMLLEICCPTEQPTCTSWSAPPQSRAAFSTLGLREEHRITH